MKLADTIHGLFLYKVSYQPWLTKFASLNTVIPLSFYGTFLLENWYLNPLNYGI